MPTGVYQHTKRPDSSIRMIGNTLALGRKHTIETKDKMSINNGRFWKGKKLTEEHKRKLSLSKKGMPSSRKGVILSEEIREKISKATKGRKSPKYWLGKKMSIEHRRKNSEAHKGEKSYLWRGGKTSINTKIRKGMEYREWRMQVFGRDNFTCRNCDKRGCYLEAHHIKSFSKYPELIFNIDNGLTLCIDCHKLTINYKNKQNA